MLPTNIRSKVFFVFTLVLGFFIWQMAPALAQAATMYAGNSGTSNVSSNWSGYTETGGQFTGVSGTWTIPAVQAASDTAQSSDATWIGIGGLTSSDLIQTGTQAVITNGQTTYQAWYETLPAVSTPMPITVNPGDSVSASLTQTSQNAWAISFHDNTNGQSYATTIPYVSSLSSAEWIEEMPSLATGHSFIPLDNFGTVTFQNALAVQNGATGNLSTFNAQPMTMTNSQGQALASPSTTGPDGASFSVTRNTSATVTSTTPGIQVRIGNGRGSYRGGSGAQGFQHRSPNTSTVLPTTGPTVSINTGGTETITITNRFGYNPFMRFQFMRFGGMRL